MLTSNLDVSNKAYSPVKVEILRHYLNNYSEMNEAKLLFEGFKKGFKIQYEGPREETMCKNLKSIDQHEGFSFERS